MNRALLTTMALAGFFAATPLEASDGPLDHANPPKFLTVEHAEILVPGRDDAIAEGYLTIWNGTNQQVSLASIRSDAFGRISVVRSAFGSGPSAAMPVEGILPVPGHAELTMRASGVRLLLEEPLSRLDGLADSRLTLVFEGGQELKVTADIIRSRDQLTIHHHGLGDTGIN
ncbi:copper chaperone PCu(A)C [Pseudaminobacter soli (ex Zhang et al. 2022)]|uniref:copper chaperone PCu(A)C n=1 Tax=Pseudaminobacter soli (ex Zhang et al. 2022) TaxID=2831468 RepID=UPI00308102DB